MSELENGFRLSELTSLIRRRMLILLMAGLVGLIIGAVAFKTAPSKFSATSRVLVQGGTSDPLATNSPNREVIDIATEQDLVKSDAVATRAAKALDSTLENRELLRQVATGSRQDSLVLEITFLSDTAEGAQAGANAFANAYLSERRNSAADQKKKQLALIKAKADFTRTSLDDAEKRGDKAAVQEFTSTLGTLNERYITFDAINTDAVGSLVRKAPKPQAVLSKMAVGRGVGLFGLCLMAGLALALLVDRTDTLGGGRREVGRLFPNANFRLMPATTNAKATETESDAAVDRFAIELTAGSRRGHPTAVVMVSTWAEPPVQLAQEVAASFGYSGIPALFVLAGSTTDPIAHARVVTSFSDLVEGDDLSGPRELPDIAAQVSTKPAPKITWLKPRGSAEASGLLRRAVVESLIARAGRDGFEVVVFLASNPTRNAAAVALGQWVDKVAIIVAHDDDRQGITETAAALAESDARVTEVVWT